jgi:NAD dependent epimerase/dehydratase
MDVEWSGRRVLVTGAGGFIGSHLCERLVRAGAEVRGFFHYGSDASIGNLGDAEPAVRDAVDPRFGDLDDVQTLESAMEGVETVFHLAALVGIPYSYQAPRDVVETNTLGTLNVLLAARETGVSRVVHTSTSEVYGTAQRVPMDETHPLNAQSPYAASKIGADQLALSFHRSFGLPVSIVRPFNTYGPRQSPRAVIAAIAAQALAGDTIRLGSTTPTRDFTFVTDTAAGFMAVAAAPAAVGGVFNLGTGREASVGEVVWLIGAALGRELTVETDAQRVRPEASEVDRLLADPALVRAVTGWQAEVPLETGIARVVAWMRERGTGQDATRYAV